MEWDQRLIPDDKTRRALMDFNQFAGRLREKLTRFSGELCGRLGKTVSRFVVEAVYGIISSQSVMLTEMGRCPSGPDLDGIPGPAPIVGKYLG